MLERVPRHRKGPQEGTDLPPTYHLDFLPITARLTLTVSKFKENILYFDSKTTLKSAK